MVNLNFQVDGSKRSVDLNFQGDQSRQLVKQSGKPDRLVNKNYKYCRPIQWDNPRHKILSFRSFAVAMTYEHATIPHGSPTNALIHKANLIYLKFQ